MRATPGQDSKCTHANYVGYRRIHTSNVFREISNSQFCNVIEKRLEFEYCFIFSTKMRRFDRSNFAKTVSSITRIGRRRRTITLYPNILIYVYVYIYI